MYTLKVPKGEFFNEELGEFFYTEPTEILLEHSLLSASKWESKYKRPFLSSKGMDAEELLDYVRMMTLSFVIDDRVYLAIPEEQLVGVLKYIEDPMTATTFREEQNRHFNRQIITTELIYYWMTSLNIPFECEKWHLNRLLALIRVCSIKSSPQKKMSKADIARQQRELNEKRKREYNTRG